MARRGGAGHKSDPRTHQRLHKRRIPRFTPPIVRLVPDLHSPKPRLPAQARPWHSAQPGPGAQQPKSQPRPGGAGLATSRTLERINASTSGEFHVSPRLSSDLCPTCALPSPGPRQALSPARPRLPSPSQPCRIWRARAAVCEGVRPTFTPTASRASAFAVAVPEEPDTIAPACPMVLPSGAVNPAT